MKKIATSLALVAASLALVFPIAASAQSDQQMDAQFNKQVYMKMADKDGMMSKSDVMKMVDQKFDKMQKNGRISVDQMGQLLRDLYGGK